MQVKVCIYIHSTLQPSPQLNSKTFVPPKRNPMYPLAIKSIFHFLSSLALLRPSTTGGIFVYKFTHSGFLLQMESHIM